MSTEQHVRQYALVAEADMTIANIGAGNEITIPLPAGALIIQQGARVAEIFNGTTNTLTVSDGTATFISAEDVKVAANTAIAVDTPNGKFYPTGGTLTVSLAQTGAATTGRVIYFVVYLVLTKWHENQF